MEKCRECQHDVKKEDLTCANCGAQYPAHKKDGWGFEYKDKTTIMGLPLIHISFKYGPGGVPVPAKGIVSVGQFGIGVINISQFGVGVISISQFTVAGYAVAQFAVAYDMIAQIGLYFHNGYGQHVWNVMELIQSF